MRDRREGMALLTVLLLLAVLSALAVLVLDDVRFSVRRGANLERGAEAQWLAIGGEALAKSGVRRLVELGPDRTPTQPEWRRRPLTLPVEGGTVTVTLDDGETCFNLNSLVEGEGDVRVRRPVGVAQFQQLGLALGLSPARLDRIADGVVDWIDTDATRGGAGAEDADYLAMALPYRTGGALLAQVEELQAIRGVDPASYAALKPFVCALPMTDPAVLNVNSLTPEQAPLLVMATQGKLSLLAAQAVLAQRPADGWADTETFWLTPALKSVAVESRWGELVGVRTRFFAASIHVDRAGFALDRAALFEVSPEDGIQTVRTAWTRFS